MITVEELVLAHPQPRGPRPDWELRAAIVNLVSEHGPMTLAALAEATCRSYVHTQQTVVWLRHAGRVTYDPSGTGAEARYVRLPDDPDAPIPLPKRERKAKLHIPPVQHASGLGYAIDALFEDGLDGAEALAFLLIMEGTLRLADLQGALRLSEGTVRRLVRALITRGLVVRGAIPKLHAARGARLHALVLAEDGQSLARIVRARMERGV